MKASQLGTYERLSIRKKAAFLALLSYHLTIRARETYVPGTGDVSDPPKLRVINEVQHRILSRIVDLLAERNVEYPDRDFWEGIEEICSRAGLAEGLESSLSWVLGHIQALPVREG